MFDNFSREQIRIKDITINLVRAGRGYPILFLHGYPQTHVCWHQVAPILSEQFTVVCTDLRGFGDSSKPFGDAEHLAYAKRTMAQDQVEVMKHLGFNTFGVVGHDRGARVAHRMALDHPEKVEKLALLDIIPTSTAFENVDKEIATNAFNWFFSIQGNDLPERLIGSESSFYLRWCIEHWSGTKGIPTNEAMSEYERCFTKEAIRATCEEFRAAASIDLLHDEAEKEKKITCPTLLLWSKNSMWATFDVMKVWQSKAENVKGIAFDCGHFLPEEHPDQTARALLDFFGKH